MTVKRVRGDNYPIEAVIKTNNVVVNITGATIKFSYLKSGDTTAKSITGTITEAANGIVQFIPGADDFTEVGTYKYDIQRLQNGVVTTHMIGQLTIDNDVNKS